MKTFLTTIAASAFVLSTSANAALIERLGGLAYYDDVADLTWLADANYAMTSGYDADGRITWQQANDWAASLTIGGVGGWRLATSDEFCNGYNCAGSEMGNLFYNVLGNTAGSLTNTGPFSNVQSNYYWSATEYAPNTSRAWYFSMRNGYQVNSYKFGSYYAWAVQSGDVSAVPVPAAVWLFGSGLLGLIGMSRRKKAA